MTETKYVVITRRGKTSVVQIKCRKVHSHSWEVKEGEFRYEILGPSFLLERDGKIEQQIWYSWAIHDSEALAINAAAGEIRLDMDKTAIKAGEGFAKLEDLKRSVAAIEIILIGDKKTNGKD